VALLVDRGAGKDVDGIAELVDAELWHATAAHSSCADPARAAHRVEPVHPRETLQEASP
jgi:hypothetical protein